MNKFINYHKSQFSVFLTIITPIFGEHWTLFGLYLLLNVVDTLTGWAKSRINQKENSNIGFIGVIKKMCSWLLILVAFFIPICFQEIGKIIHVDLSITDYLGWFVLASLIINEYRSILENLVEAGCNVPKILVKGLENVSQKIESVVNDDE